MRHKRADNDTADLNNPVPIPSGATLNWAWVKHEKIMFNPGPSAQISNLQWYADASPGDWTGLTLWVGITPGYTLAGDNTRAAAQGGPTTQETAKLYSSMVDAETLTSVSPLTVLAGAVLGAGEVGVGVTQQFVVQQISVSSATTQGVKTQRNVFWRWSEI